MGLIGALSIARGAVINTGASRSRARSETSTFQPPFSGPTSRSAESSTSSRKIS